MNSESAFNNINNSKYWKTRSMDPIWYNRKKALVFGQGHPYRDIGEPWIPHLTIVFFKYLDVIIDEEGTHHTTLESCVESITKKYRSLIDPSWTKAMTVVWKGSKLGIQKQ